MGLYLVKLLHSPLSFTFSDELQHWRTAGDIIESGYLFAKIRCCRSAHCTQGWKASQLRWPT